ncbi:Uncharacterised protein [Candidatus Norongarragalina meridionalis]|nr:Uncharacterised protein [Candidatus Norongarragalina meridionalis]
MAFSQLNALLGLIAALALALYAFTRQDLSSTGTLAALFVGMIVFSFGGWTWFLLLVMFFVSSSWLTAFREKEKTEVQKEFAKGGVRDFWQVMANGSLPALFALLFFLRGNVLFFVAFVGALATANADTWATELGVLSERPRMITNGKRVAKGASGAVSGIGLLAALAGAAFIALCAVGLNLFNNYLADAQALGILRNYLVDLFVGGGKFVFVVIAAGFLGCLADSFFGATIQGMFWCPKCKKETERHVHRCGFQTHYYKGFTFVDNDVVNFLSACFGALAAIALYELL